MRPRSLALRLTLLAMLGSLAALALAGVVIAGLLRNFILDSYDTRLDATMVGLMAATSINSTTGRLSIDATVADTRFETPFSGWYWQISDGEDPLIRSGSLWTENLKPGDIGPQGEHLLLKERQFTAPGGTNRLIIRASAPMAEIESDAASIIWPLVISLVLLALGLGIAIAAQIFIGLRPMRRLSGELGEIAAGRRETLTPSTYSEIQPIVARTNTLIEANRQTLERARTHAGNLAHGLKTPIAIIASEIDRPQIRRDVISEAMTRMDELVRHHLRRARAGASATARGVATPVGPVVDDLLLVFRGLTADRGLTLAAEIAPNLKFAGERQDLEELLGNLIDNACKWARGHVKIGAERLGARLVITIRDDGRGMSVENLARVGERGRRFDESRPGSGLGLSIVQDLAQLYGGTLDLTSAPDQGTTAKLELPAI